jgi:hypothetical protein
MQFRGWISAIAVSSLAAAAIAAEPKSVPHLEKRGNVTPLIVDGKPFLALAGEGDTLNLSGGGALRTLPGAPVIARASFGGRAGNG